MNQPVTLYRAVWCTGTIQPFVVVCEALFVRKPKSWRRGRTGKPEANDWIWGYKHVFQGERCPGFETPGAAVQALLEATERNIAHKEKTLEEERRKLASVQDYLRGLSA